MSDNHYESPSANLTPPNEAKLEPRKAQASDGWQWLVKGAEYFLAAPGAWFGAMMLLAFGFVVLAFIPGVKLLLNIIAPIISAGFMYSCEQIRLNGEFKFDNLFKGFSLNLNQLAIVGLIYSLSVYLVLNFSFRLPGLLGYSSIDFQNPEAIKALSPEQLINNIALPALVAMALIVPVLMAYWFAPALVILRGLKATSAFKLSFKACYMNIVPFLVYGIGGFLMVAGLMLIVNIVASISMFIALPVMIGCYLVMMSVFMASNYTSFIGIFPPADSEDENQSADTQDQMIA
ncbi:BPSS1780 family membrane protein [Aliikangiella sp. IMCC44632]